ncbi:MAG: hypothetical protein KBD29_03660 [Candidatus Magasanikbacteria bacterium]|nr:hypothetical protein [Candidatus Magasanikbacteria bacterium]
MSESESQIGCSKHGPFSVCKHTDADCPDSDIENPTGKEKREYIPTPEEVIAIIKEIIGEKEYT